MKIPKLGLRTWTILLFVLVTIAGFSLLNFFYQKSQNESKALISSLSIVEELKDLDSPSPRDRTTAGNVISALHQYKSANHLLWARANRRNATILFFLILISSAIIIFFVCKISQPLRELKAATDLIRKGNFSVHLPETGLYEMKMLKNSFNMMSFELEAIQTKLLVTEKELIWKDLSRILAHEIKNPLTPIQLAIQRLEEKLESEPDTIKELLPQSIQIISQEVENLKLLAQDFSNYAKISQAKKEPFNPAAYLEEICRSYVSDYKLNLSMVPNERIEFDKTHFYQIVTNIIQNAIDASQPESPIHIDLIRDRSYLVLSIRDEGSGIETEDLPRIFEPYFSKKGKGTGLGLALVKRLSEANNAVVRVKSKLGEGSEFILIMEA
ncbi:MAG: HAMP domain-containing sensor histidine kinase [Candidatus Cloacimonetes bacterium]|nr:HAMP domain-containing sensor histidine kinase [Candidatus Cloacimonadota bacterium]